MPRNYVKKPPRDWSLTIAQRQLVEENAALAVSIAVAAGDRGADLDDTISAAYLGLIRAAKKFDPDRGLRFATYATPWIRSFVIDHRHDQRLVRIPKHVRNDKETYAEVSARCSTVSLSGHGRYCDEDWDLAAPAPREDGAPMPHELAHLRAAVRSLPDRQRAVILADLDGVDTAETARRLGIDRRAVWAARKEAMASLAATMGGGEASRETREESASWSDSLPRKAM